MTLNRPRPVQLHQVFAVHSGATDPDPDIHLLHDLKPWLVFHLALFVLVELTLRSIAVLQCVVFSCRPCTSIRLLHLFHLMCYV